MKKFWNWNTRIRNVANDDGTVTKTTERTLYLNGAIASESWYDDEVTPQLFREDLFGGEGDISVWINSPGGDCIAAAQIYNMLQEYKSKGKVTVKIDGLAASAASVVAMAGDETMISPVGMLMIHDPSTCAWGNITEFKQTLQMLEEVKESIINAYTNKTTMDRAGVAKLMEDETWMSAQEALDKGFVDGIMYQDDDLDDALALGTAPMAYSPIQVTNSIQSKIAAKCRIKGPDDDNDPNGTEPPAEPPAKGQPVSVLMDRLDLIHKYF